MAKSSKKKKQSAPEKVKGKAVDTAEETVEKAQENPAEKAADDALESFLSRSPEPAKGGEAEPAKNKKKLSTRSIVLIVAIVLVAALIIAVVVAANQPVTPAADDEDLPEKPVEMATTIDEKGEHHVEISTDAEGEIVQNGYGELISYVPAQISKIEVENTAGSFVVNSTTPEGHETVYTITGFEGYELRAGMADAVANDAATISFTTVAAVGGKMADFGLDKPRATVKVTYTDNTTAVIRVGNEADGGVGTYAALGDDQNVFLVANDAVDSFLYNVLDMISFEITTKADSVENDSFSVIELSGSHYPDPITIVPNTDEAVKANYRLTQPYEMFADNYEGNDISGSIRDLYAESVVCVNPNDNQLGSYGVKQPYAKVHAVYPDTEIHLSCSAPTDDGLVNLYNPDKGIIYTIRMDALGWANTDLDQLLPKTVIELNKDVISGVTVSSGGKDYAIEINHTKEKIINESGDEEEIAAIEGKLNGKTIPEASILIFFQNFNAMSNLGTVKESGTNIIYRWKVSYTNGRADDIIAIYDTGDKSCPVALNGVIIGSVSKSHASALQQDIIDIAAGKTPKSL